MYRIYERDDGLSCLQRAGNGDEWQDSTEEQTSLVLDNITVNVPVIEEWDFFSCCPECGSTDVFEPTGEHKEVSLSSIIPADVFQSISILVPRVRLFRFEKRESGFYLELLAYRPMSIFDRKIKVVFEARWYDTGVPDMDDYRTMHMDFNFSVEFKNKGGYGELFPHDS